MRTHEDFLRAVSTQMKVERVAAGLTLDELRTASGVARSSLALFERGERTPNIKQVMMICDALGLDVVTFMSRAEERANS